MKKIFAVILLAHIIGSFVLGQPVKEHGSLKVIKTQLVDQYGNPIVLRGVSFGWHNWWPRFYSEGTVNWLCKDWGCTVVRAAIGAEPENGYISNPESSMKCLKTVVDAAIKNGIYVIIDWHCHHIRLEEAIRFFSEAARLYKSYPNIIYEVFNEPDYQSWDEVRAYETEVINTIRKIDPNNIILVGSPHWDQFVNLPAEKPILGFTNLMYTLHYYAGTHRQELRNTAEYALSKGIPLFVSESAGMEASGDGMIDYKEWEAWRNWTEKNKISWVTWSVSDKKESCSFLFPNASSEGNWKESDLNESGKYTRTLLKRFQGK